MHIAAGSRWWGGVCRRGQDDTTKSDQINSRSSAESLPYSRFLECGTIRAKPLLEEECSMAVYKYQVIAINARTDKNNLASQLNDLGNTGFRVVAVWGNLHHS